MSFRRSRFVLLLTLLLTLAHTSLAHAQKVELGSSLINAMFTTGDDNVTIVGVPSGGFTMLSPAVYGSFFLGPKVAIEPQVGLLWISHDDDSDHILNLTGQIDYFLLGSDRSSPYLFAAAGLIEASGTDHTPKTYGGGIGYRVLFGDRLAMRFDGRYTHYTSGNGGDGENTVSLTMSIGGVFGQR